MTEFSFDVLRRHPDVEADNLFAVDASDRLILDEAAEALDAAGDGRVAVIGDHYGALTLAAAGVLGLRDLRVHQDGLVAERALAANAARFTTTPGIRTAYRSLPLGRELLEGATVVLLQLPRALDELDAVARAVASWADPAVVLVAGGRVKHMTPAMNEVLAALFMRVDVSLARQKSRVLLARSPRSDVTPAEPRREHSAELGLDICAVPGAFAGAKLDLGTRRLLAHLEAMRPDARTAIDLGCGTGVLAAQLARSRPELRVAATDQSEAAVESTRLTLAANGLGDDLTNGRITVVRDDALSGFDDASADLIVLNPPFHTGSTVHAGIALKLFEAAGRVLAPGGELWTVFNSHLAYRSALQRAVGATTQIDRDPKFTVMRSLKR
ncbi:MAG: class I SAM-dependent methyltransferase [Herbiconiux sp.]|nr:class I SAM-dependent methyltransferase [Herbiconiux sp.]